MDKFWTDERVARCKQLWADGWSAMQIAADPDFGCTRNAVLSKIHRSGSAERTMGPTVPVQRKPRPRSPTTTNFAAAASLRFQEAVPEAPPPTPEDAIIGFGPGKSLLALEAGECRWPLGTPGTLDFRFCAASRFGLAPYCHNHALVAGYRAAFRPAR